MSDDDEAKYAMDAPGMSVSSTPGGLASAANPYHVQFDGLKLARQEAGGANMDYVFPEQHGEKTYDWTASIFWGTGLAYLGGSAAGGAWGLTEALRRPDGTSTNMRVNSILNACGRRGPQLGNRMGILAFLFTFSDGAIIKLRDGENDMANKVGAGMIAGALFSSTSGPRRAAVSAVAGGVLAGVGLVVQSVGGSFVESVYEPEYR